MSLQELNQNNTTAKSEPEEMSFQERVLSWGRKPAIAKARMALLSQPKTTMKAGTSFNLKCRQMQNTPNFDVAMTVSPDGNTVHFKNVAKKINSTIPLQTLTLSGADMGPTDWISLRTSDGTLSVKRRSLMNALQAFGVSS